MLLTLFSPFNSVSAPQTVLHIIEDIDLLGREPSGEHENDEQPPAEDVADLPPPPALPLYKPGRPTDDNLDQVSLNEARTSISGFFFFVTSWQHLRSY